MALAKRKDEKVFAVKVSDTTMLRSIQTAGKQRRTTKF
jgi:hypothetical protein